MSVIQTTQDIIAALASGNNFQLKSAFEAQNVYWIVLPLMLVSAWLLARIFRLIPILDRNIEKWLMIVIYLVMTGIIFVEVIRRFTVGDQVPWSSTLPPYLFLVMTWVGCSYSVKRRMHLAFGEVRSMMSRRMQMMCLTLDAVLWLLFALIVVVTGLRQTINALANFQILLGTDNVMQWWFYAFVPASWLVLAARAIENWEQDWAKYKTDEPLIEQASLVSGE